MNAHKREGRCDVSSEALRTGMERLYAEENLKLYRLLAADTIDAEQRRQIHQSARRRGERFQERDEEQAGTVLKPGLGLSQDLRRQPVLPECRRQPGDHDDVR